MRADRLLALLMLLQTRGKTTAARLAEELEVSDRTLYRDLYALRVAGFPVCTERGPQGGCSLEDGFRNRLTGLKRSELAALFMANVPAPLVQLGVADDLRSALLKLSAALSAGSPGTLKRDRQRIYLDSAPWSATSESVEHLALLHRAVREERWVVVTFERIQQIRSVRRIAPYGLVAKGTTWHVIWAGEDGRLRVDRVSRVLRADLRESRFEPPANFDLERFWKDWCLRQEQKDSSFSVTLCVSAAALSILRPLLGRGLEEIEKVDGLRGARLHRVKAAFPSVEEARERLLALGSGVEVLEPRALRLTLHDFAEQAASVYRDG